jgi:hypothetical protein
VLRGWLASTEAAARAIKAEPWEPLPSMVKRQSPGCRYFFAAPGDSQELRCPYCVAKGERSRQAGGAEQEAGG